MVDLDIAYPYFTNMTEILFKDSAGTWKGTEKANQKDFAMISIGYFIRDSFRAGTGFVIKVLSEIPEAALILTAAHIFLEDFVFKPEILEFMIEGEAFHAMPLWQNLDFDNENEFLLDPISGNRTSVPKDYCVCLLMKIPGKKYRNRLTALAFYEKLENVAEGTSCLVLGYPLPVKSRELEYVAPSATDAELKKIRKCLYNGEELVLSRGKILKNEEMYCISCPTANGMSGSPVLIETVNGLKVIGILHGGPAGFLHFPISVAINGIQLGDGRNAIRKLFRFLTEFLNERKKTSLLIPNNLDVFNLFLGNVEKNIVQGAGFTRNDLNFMHYFYSECLIQEFEMGTRLDYNLCMPLSRFYRQVNDALQAYK